MTKIWANRLIAGDKTWAEVPDFRRNGIKAELAARVKADQITAEKYTEITGEAYEG